MVCVILLEIVICFLCLSEYRHNPSLHITSPAQPGTLHLFPWSAIFAVVLACFFTIPAELLMIRLCRFGWWLVAGLEHGRVFANVEGVTVSDPNCNVTVGVMFWFAYFSVVFCIHAIYIRRKQWCLRLTVCLSMCRTVIIQVCQGKYSFPFNVTFNLCDFTDLIYARTACNSPKREEYTKSRHLTRLNNNE